MSAASASLSTDPSTTLPCSTEVDYPSGQAAGSHPAVEWAPAAPAHAACIRFAVGTSRGCQKSYSIPSPMPLAQAGEDLQQPTLGPRTPLYPLRRTQRSPKGLRIKIWSHGLAWLFSVYGLRFGSAGRLPSFYKVLPHPSFCNVQTLLNAIRRPKARIFAGCENMA